MYLANKAKIHWHKIIAVLVTHMGNFQSLLTLFNYGRHTLVDINSLVITYIHSTVKQGWFIWIVHILKNAFSGPLNFLCSGLIPSYY